MISWAHAQTLYSLIADGGHRPTSLRQEDWLSLLTNSSLESFPCWEQGFNARMGKRESRIGMIGKKRCDSPERSILIGFGSTGNYSCGSFKKDNVSGKKNVPSFGYILGQ